MNSSRFYLARTKYNQNGFQSIQDVFKDTGITKSLIAELEAGTKSSEASKMPRQVGHLTIKKLAEHYDVTSDYLLGLEDEPTREQSVNISAKTTGLSVESIQVLQFINNHSGQNDDCSKNNMEIIRFLNRVLSKLDKQTNVDDFGIPDPIVSIFNYMEQYVDSAKAATPDGDQMITIDYGSACGRFTVSEVSRNILLARISKALEVMYEEVSGNGKKKKR